MSQPASMHREDVQQHRHRSPLLLHLATYLFAGLVMWRAAEVVMPEQLARYTVLGLAVGAVFSYSLQRFERVLSLTGLVFVAASLGAVAWAVYQQRPPVIVTLEWTLMGLILALAYTAYAPRHYATICVSALVLVITSIRHLGSTPLTFLVPAVGLALLTGVALQGSAPLHIAPASRNRTILPWYLLLGKLLAIVFLALLLGRQLADRLPVPRIDDQTSPIRMWITYARTNLGLEPDFTQGVMPDPDLLKAEATEVRRGLANEFVLDLSRTSPDRLSRKLLYTVGSTRPVYLRTMALDHYSGLVWAPSMKMELEPLHEGREPYQFMVPDRPTGDASDVSCRIWPQSNTGYVLPIPAFARTVIRGNLGRVYQDPLHNLYAGESVGRGTHYECRLVEVDASSLAGIRIGDDDVAIAEQYLQLPEVSEALIEFCQQELDGELNRLAAVHELIAAVRRGKTYSVAPVTLPRQVAESTEYFLFHMERGACTQYASALAVMCRIVGIPARVVIGYGPGTYRSTAMHYEVREKDAHAWTQVWFPEIGWVDIDATPNGLSLAAPEEPQVTAERPTIETWLSERKEDWRKLQAAALGSWQRGSAWAAARKMWPVYGLAFMALLVAGWWGGRHLGRRGVWWWRWRQSRQAEPRRAAAISYQYLLVRLERAGCQIESSQTPSELIATVREHQYPCADQFEELTHLAERFIFGPNLPTDEEVESLRRQIAELPLKPPTAKQPEVPADTAEP